MCVCMQDIERPHAEEQSSLAAAIFYLTRWHDATVDVRRGSVTLHLDPDAEGYNHPELCHKP